MSLDQADDGRYHDASAQYDEDKGYPDVAMVLSNFAGHRDTHQSK
jgi:hypothetical protein